MNPPELTAAQRQGLRNALKLFFPNPKACQRINEFFEKHGDTLPKDLPDNPEIEDTTGNELAGELAHDVDGWLATINSVVDQLIRCGLPKYAAILRESGPGEFADVGDSDWSPEESGLLTLIEGWQFEVQIPHSQNPESEDRESVESKRTPRRKQTKSSQKKITIEERMKLLLFDNPDSYGWTVTQFQKELKCSRECQAWVGIIVRRAAGHRVTVEVHWCPSGRVFQTLQYSVEGTDIAHTSPPCVRISQPASSQSRIPVAGSPVRNRQRTERPILQPRGNFPDSWCRQSVGLLRPVSSARYSMSTSRCPSGIVVVSVIGIAFLCRPILRTERKTHVESLSEFLFG